MHPVSCTNTNDDITGLVNHGMVKNTKAWISWERNITFLQNKKILHLCLRWYILRIYHFVAEVTFKERLQHRCFPVIYMKFLRTSFSQNTSGGCFWNKLIWLNLFQVMILAKQLKKWCCIFLLLLRINDWIFLKMEIFYSILRGGSQARKTKHDKEMVLIRTERKGIL